MIKNLMKHLLPNLVNNRCVALVLAGFYAPFQGSFFSQPHEKFLDHLLLPVCLIFCTGSRQAIGLVLLLS